MAAPSPDLLYVALLEKALAWLAAAFIVVGGSFSGVIVYIYKQGQKTVTNSLDSMEKRIGDVADSLGKMAEKLFDKTDELSDRTAHLESKFERREGICEERHGSTYPYRRITDRTPHPEEEI